MNTSITSTVLSAHYSVAEIFGWVNRLMTRVVKDGETYHMLENVAVRLGQGVAKGVMTQEYRAYGNIMTLVMATEGEHQELSTFAEDKLRRALMGVVVKVQQEGNVIPMPVNRVSRRMNAAYAAPTTTTGLNFQA